MLFEQAHVDAVARALADDGLTGTEIGHLIRVCNMGEQDPGVGIPADRVHHQLHVNVRLTVPRE